MSVKKLDFAEPFYTVLLIDNEESFEIGKRSMVVNLAERAQSDLYIKKIPLEPLRGTIVENVTLKHITKAMVVEDYLRTDLNDYMTIKAIKAAWPTLYDASGLPRHKGLPYYKSPKYKEGEGRDHLELNFCFVSEPLAPSGPHHDHDRDFDEVHAQIRGYGKMRIFEENDYATYYRELNMAEGTVHQRMYDVNGDYPWHEYQSVTPGIYCPIEMDRG